jgi:hypothetical protein
MFSSIWGYTVLHLGFGLERVILPATMDSAPLAVNAEGENAKRNDCIVFC